MPVRGSLIGVAGRSIHGWVAPDRTGAGQPTVTLFANGEEIGQTLADRAGPVDGAFGFSIPFARLFQREGQVHFEARSEGQAFASLDQNFGVGLSDLFAGQVEGVANGVIRGWAVNLGAGEIPITLNVHLGALWLGSTITDQPRGDIRRRFGVKGDAGFGFPIPAPFRTSKAQAFRLFYANTAIELEGSPLVFPEGRAGPKADALAALLG